MKQEAEKIVQSFYEGHTYKELVDIAERYLQNAEQGGYKKGYNAGFRNATGTERQDISVSSEPTIGSGERNITRVEVIDQEGRSYVNWDAKNSVFTSIQDEGRTLKVFIKDKV